MSESEVNINNNIVQIADKKTDAITTEIEKPKDQTEPPIQETAKPEVENSIDSKTAQKDDLKYEDLTEGEIISDFEKLTTEYEDVSSDSEDFNSIMQLQNEVALKKIEEKRKKKPLNFSTNKNTIENINGSNLNDFSKHKHYRSHLKNTKIKIKNENKVERKCYASNKRARSSEPEYLKVVVHERASSKSNESCDFKNTKLKKYKILNKSYRSRHHSLSPEKKRKTRDSDDCEIVDAFNSKPKRKCLSGNENKFPNSVKKKRSIEKTSNSTDVSTSTRKKKRKNVAHPPPVSLRKRLNLIASNKSELNKNSDVNNKSIDNQKTENGHLSSTEQSDKPVKETKSNRNVLSEAGNSSPDGMNNRQIENENATVLNTDTVIPSDLPILTSSPPTSDQVLVTEEPSSTCVDLLSLPIPFPKFSVDNLPLTPGPNKLPIHVTATGEKIPYDMEGRKIPIGPNGHYLPLDPTGRLFPHIVSPNNRAIPIHMTKDGIIRLPDSKPIPFGPPHTLPINIDGSIILIGPDSRALFPCFNLPTQPPPPLILENSMQPYVIEFHQTENIENHFTENNYHVEASSVTDSNQTLPTNFVTATLIKNYQNKDIKRQETFLEYIKIEKKLFLGDWGTSELLLDSSASESRATSKSVTKSKRRNNESFSNWSSSDEEDALQIICDVPTKGDKPMTSFRSKPKDEKVTKIELAIKSLCEENYVPEKFGRFIVPNHFSTFANVSTPYESPLLRNRVRLPYTTPMAEILPSHHPAIQSPNFDFFAHKKQTDTKSKNNSASSDKVCTFDFAMQCDFTSSIFRALNDKITKKNKEIIRLQEENSKLLFARQRSLQMRKRHIKH